MNLNQAISESKWAVQRAASIHLDNKVELMRANKKAGRELYDTSRVSHSWNCSMKLLLIREHNLSVLEEAKRYNNK